jgi:nicotinamidase-related amidase
MAFAQKVALVVIDMQPRFVTRGGKHNVPDNQLKTRQVLERQIYLIQAAKAHHVPIVQIEYQNYGETHDMITQQIGDYDLTRTFLKSADGMFAPRGGIVNELRAYLDSLGVTDLLVTGANGGYCVRCSIEGALIQGYKIWADNLAIIDFNPAEFHYPYKYSDNFFRVDPNLAQKNFFQTEELSLMENLLRGPRGPTQCLVAHH